MVRRRVDARETRLRRARRTISLSLVAVAALTAPVTASLVARSTARAATRWAHAATSVGVSWTSLGPSQIVAPSVVGGAGKINAVAVDPQNPQVMYAAGGVGPGDSGPGSTAGIFGTTNGGATWTALDTGLTETAVTSLWIDPLDPSVLLSGVWYPGIGDNGAATSTSGIFRTANGGRTWSAVASFGPTSGFASLAGSLFAATSQGVAVSTDDGVSWTLAEPTTSPVRAVATGGTVVWAGLENGAVVRRTSAGAAWVSVYSSPGDVWSIAVPPGSGDTAYVVERASTPALLMTSDDGAHWSVLAPPSALVPIQVVACDANTPGVVYVSSNGGFAVSNDRGQTWSLTSTNTGLDSRFLWSWPGRVDTLINAGDQGIIESTTQGENWTSLNGNLANSLLFDVATQGSEILVAAQDYQALESTDGGATWRGAAGAEGGTVAIDPANAHLQFLDNLAGVFRSTDGGTTWSPPSGLGPPSQLSALSQDDIVFPPDQPSVVYIVASSGVWRSTDGGADFAAVTNWTGAPTSYLTFLAFSPASASTIYLGSYSGVYRSIDGGLTWRAATGLPDGPGNYPETIAIDPANPAVVLVGTSAPPGPGGVFRSVDGGTSFAATSGAFPSGPNTTWGNVGTWNVTFEPTTTNPVAIAEGVVSGIAVSFDGGVTWWPARGNATSSMFTGASWQGSRLYVSTMGEGVLESDVGAWSAPTSSTTPPASGPGPVTIEGVVVDSAHRAAPGACVRLSPGGEITTTATTGRFSFVAAPERTVTLTIDPHGCDGRRASASGPWRHSEELGTASRINIVAVLSPGLRARGTVRGGGGGVLSGLCVAAEPPGDPSGLVTATTNRDGSFLLSGLPRGRLELRVNRGCQPSSPLDGSTARVVVVSSPRVTNLGTFLISAR